MYSILAKGPPYGGPFLCSAPHSRQARAEAAEKLIGDGAAGGGEFFGKVGSFESGYEFDAIVMDDSALPTTRRCTLTERLERVVWLSDGLPSAKYVAGRRLF